MHRDIKPENFLIDSTGSIIKLADFGLARAFDLNPTQKELYTRDVISLWYRSPEVLLGYKSYDTSLDLWSLGLIMIEMATKYPIFAGENEIEQTLKIFEVLGSPTPESNISKYLKSFRYCPVWPSYEK
jgi:serine/threonine protein kinase